MQGAEQTHISFLDQEALVHKLELALVADDLEVRLDVAGARAQLGREPSAGLVERLVACTTHKDRSWLARTSI
jgi:hypothetical protein